MLLVRKISVVMILMLLPMMAVAEPTNTNTDKEATIKFYPNPVTEGVIYVQSENKISNIQVINILGQPVAEVRGLDDYKADINVAGKDKGVYFLRVKLKNGNLITKRILIN